MALLVLPLSACISLLSPSVQSITPFPVSRTVSRESGEKLRKKKSLSDLRICSSCSSKMKIHEQITEINLDVKRDKRKRHIFWRGREERQTA